MDARSGTSTPTTEMDATGTSAAEMDAAGTSGDTIGESIVSPVLHLTPSRIERSHESFSGFSGPHKPRSSFAAETEHRSRLADVDNEPRPSTAAVAERRSRTADVSPGHYTEIFRELVLRDDAHMGTDPETGTVDKDSFIKKWAD
jgi:hypothetical protein